MNPRIELGRIGGIPVFLDMFFVLVLIIFSHRYFTGGDTQMMSAGILIIAGVVASILLHELGHAVAAWAFKVRIAQIELTGLGGLIQFDSSLPRAVLPQMTIHLAGPAVNFLIYLGAYELAGLAAEGQKPLVAFVLLQIAIINIFLCIFNLLPAFPLDGGHALDALLGRVFGPTLGRRIVGGLGVVVAILIALYALQSLPGSLFMLLLAFFIAELNWNALQNKQGGSWF